MGSEQTPSAAPVDGIVSIAALTTCSVRWVVQKRDDMDIWRDCPSLGSDCKDVADRNRRHVCQSLISELDRHRLVRRVTFDFLEQC